MKTVLLEMLTRGFHDHEISGTIQKSYGIRLYINRRIVV